MLARETDMWMTALLGIVGGAIPEILRLITYLRAGSVPTLKEAIASVLVALLGLGVLLFDTKGQSRLQIAVLGAAFPSLFTGLVAASTRPSLRGSESGFRNTVSSMLDYLSWRF
jgi:hypothetical protein